MPQPFPRFTESPADAVALRDARSGISSREPNELARWTPPCAAPAPVAVLSAEIAPCYEQEVRAVVQRVSSASVDVGDERVGEIGPGLLVYLGAGGEDGPEDVAYTADKVLGLRVFEDEDGKMSRSVTDVGGGVLVVPQFTLYGDVRKGRRPSFTRGRAARAGRAPLRASRRPNRRRACARRYGSLPRDDGGRRGRRGAGHDSHRQSQGVLSVEPRFEIRAVTRADEPDLLELAGFLNSVNLPNDEAAMRPLVEHSERSFSGTEGDPRRREYIFVLYDRQERRAVGTSLIVGQLGRRDAPYIYFDVKHEERYSQTLTSTSCPRS